MLEILIPLNINFTLEEEFIITNLSEKIHNLEIEKVTYLSMNMMN
jgi:hypothetical protein